jgi:TRAP-type mannitol/chloroaromatic compound transport system permease small subunit
MSPLIRAYVRLIDRISDYVGYLAMYLIFVMVAILLLDAVTRNMLTIPLHWCVEFAQFTLVAYYFLGGAMTLKDNDHVRMDLFYASLTDRGRHRMDLVMLACLMFYLVVMFIGSYSSLVYAIETGERRFSMWNPSVIPIKVLMLICIGLMILQTISLAFKHIAALRGEVLT